MRSKAERPRGRQSQSDVMRGAANEYLASARAEQFRELENDPELRDTVERLIATENWNPEGRAAIMESLSNRARYRGRSIREEVYSGFYGPINRGQLRHLNEAEREASRRAMEEVRRGSNQIEGRTEQGMINEHPYARRVGPDRSRLRNIGGEYFSDLDANAAGWAQRENERARQSQTIPPAASRGDDWGRGARPAPYMSDDGGALGSFSRHGEREDTPRRDSG